MMPDLSQRALLEAAAEGLRKIATDPRCVREFARPGSALRDLLSPAARRYVLAPDRTEFLARVTELRAKGYRVTAEFAAPDRADDPAQVRQVVDEYLGLLEGPQTPDRIGVDLTGVGLAVSPELALANAGRIATAAAARGSEVVLGMGRSPTVDAALAVHRELTLGHPDLGLTLQAQLHRTLRDAGDVARPGRPIRLVKGAFQELPELALRRGPALDDRYLDLAQDLVDRGVRLSLATQDPELLATADRSGLLSRVTDIEMLYGVQPGLLRTYRTSGHTCRIYTTYGTNWWPHLLQRLTEHPPLVLSALADIGAGRPCGGGSGY
ncbi:proline dehydrogenase family protein [Streptomyces boluensis]|uniref:Proline dehydrogenase n=1 Tax=Streptomyces boluensis TaxID=1775135 RepID=A0A964USV8_9ACTN|nr:proline dehydrogenase family protein [Streptomyces boluensis]NBE53866.1 proline dehydrogenase [Streptomyces boluensis]